MISIDSVVKQYSPSVRIGSISLDIPAGGITALVGPNGAGKSTLLTMVGRLLGIDDVTEITRPGGIGIEKFNEECRSSVLRYTKEWEDYVTRQARWVDFDNDYKTLDTDSM